MEAKEAPERIYCESDGLGNIIKAHNIKWPDDEAENIEYIRKDVFIEKAAVWIANRYQSNGSCLDANDIDDFEKYMKGEVSYGKNSGN